jgi:chemotaxis methyl-accepting protein methylase/signal transduction histidine kinase/chemotaxis response regulator CheB
MIHAPLIVGVGASAGGLDALQAFLRGVPVGRGVAFVVVFHVDPHSRGLLPEALARSTPLAVVEAVEGMPVEVDRVYVAPGHSFVGLEGGVLRITPVVRAKERRAIIDRFFYSLARDQQTRAVAVVLSGAGSDGSLGLKAVGDAGGLTMVQDPATAKHHSMPQSASDTAAADHVLPPEQLAEELLAYAGHVGQSAAPQREADLFREVAEALPRVCEILLQATGHNFKHYKTSTLTRRAYRRIQVLRAAGVREYLEVLRSDRGEANRLFRELLINVTAFFRDPEAFEVLDAEVLRALFAERAPGDPVRVWVPGCATGEEAYTIAMLLRERMEGLAHPPEVQVFATDLDEEALAIARQGSYPLGIAEELPATRLERFFVKKGQQYQVVKELRELILFSTHNLINDPPFSKLDLISCRNLLIYLGPHLQKKLIPLFHYALRSGGYLFLGSSENLGAHRELFRAVDAKNRISQRLPTAIRSVLSLGDRPASLVSVRPPNVPAPADADTYLVMQRIILDEFAPKAVVVNEEGQMVSASGNLEKYLTVTAGTFHNNVIRLVREGLRSGLRAALTEATRVRRKVVHDGLSLRTEAGVQRMMITVQPMPQLGEHSGLFMVVFQDVGLPLAPDAPSDAPPHQVSAALIDQLERELTSTRDDLEQSVQDLEVANEELKSSNEELLSMNEELQSANEELETSKEEVQEANEALAGSNADLENLLASTRIATLFLDDGGNVRRLTPDAGAVYNLLPGDSGRPLDHFTHRARLMPPLPSAEAVLGAEKPFEDEVEMHDGSWYLRRVLPYRTLEGVREGIVVTFTDVTDRRRTEEALKVAHRRKDEFLATLAHELRNPLAPLQNGLQLLAYDADGQPAVKVLEVMERQLSHMVRLIDDLMDISRISSGKVSLREDRVSLQAVIEQAVEASRPLIDASRHTLTVDLPGEPIWVHADLTRLAQVVSNLLNNASKYTPDGGRIDLSVAREGDSAVVRVADTGLGIPKEMLSEVFEMFTQVNRTLDRAQGGLGIGLALVKKVVEMHRGTITAESAGAGHGSTFTVRVPAIAAETAPLAPPRTGAMAKPAAVNALRVLVVDDNRDAAQTLAMLLELSGSTVRTVFSGAEAVDAARELVPAVVFLDIGLPGMDGYEVARRLRQDPALATTTIVALTGWGSDADKRKTKEAGFDHHFTKPVKADQIRRLLATLVEGAQRK